jgi:hypothetical protein
MNRPPTSETIDENDARAIEWGRERDKGYRKYNHHFQQTVPMFFTQDNHSLWLGDLYRGRSAFLICGGPSFAKLDHAPLAEAGMLTMGINNSPRTFRPNLWASVDSPDHWIRSIWLDPTITKFVPTSHANKRIFDSNKWRFPGDTVGSCPNIIYYRRNEQFNAERFLWEDSMNWGNHTKFGGGRSIMLPAIRILFILGIRKIFLLGCDFNMSPTATYHFDQARHRGSVSGNSATYQKLNEWFKQLRPHFEKEGLQIFNCNPESNLKAFPFISYEEALGKASSHMCFIDFANERTRNLYDTDTREKEEGTGKSMTWFRAQAKGLRKCRYCGKGCARVAGDTQQPGILASDRRMREGTPQALEAGCWKIQRTNGGCANAVASRERGD